MSGPWAITVFVVAVIVAILIHELGHLWTAKIFGIRADRYFVGFGPTLWSTRRGETEYGVKLLPLGGFVRIQGMSPADERQPPVVDEVLPADAGGDAAADGWRDRLVAAMRARGAGSATVTAVTDRVRDQVGSRPGLEATRVAVRRAIEDLVPGRGRIGDLRHRLLEGDRGRFYEDQAPWRRAVVIAAGPLTHLVIAFVLLAGLYAVEPLNTGELEPVVAAVQEDSPADVADLRAGDRLVAVDGVRADGFETLRDELRAAPGRAVEVTYLRDGVERTVTLTPAPAEDPETGETIGQIGFVPTQVTEQLGPFAAAREAVSGEVQPELGRPGGVFPMVGLTFSAMGQIFSPDGLASMTGQAFGGQERSMDGAVSLIGAASLAGQAADGPGALYVLVVLLATINVFLMIFNLLPLPPLDGGHLAVVGVEKAVNTVRGWRGRATDFTVDPNWVGAIALPVIVFMVLFGVTILWLDIANPISF